MALNLRKLYHPGGLMYNRTGLACFAGEEVSCTCPCGCKDDRQLTFMALSPEQMGIRGTPGMRTVAAIKKRERAARAAAKPPVLPSPWKGATRSKGEVTLPGDECNDFHCTQEHVFDNMHPGETPRHHIATYPAIVYTLGNATVKIRTDKKSPIKT
jgi:hypothetical protein